MFVLLLCTNTAAVKEPKIIEKRAIFILLKRSFHLGGGRDSGVGA